MFLAAAVVVIVLASSAPALAAPTGDGRGIRNMSGFANSDTRSFDLRNSWARAGEQGPLAGRAAQASSDRPTPRYRESLICYDGRGGEAPAPDEGWCQSGGPQTGVYACDPDEYGPPRWRQWVYADGTTTPWERLDEGSCGPVLPVLTVEDFRSLPLPAPTLRLQPDGGWVLVNIDTIVMTDAATVPLRTTLAGFGVDVEAVPQSFTYDFGDGHSLRTTSPGRPYPEHDTSHAYEAPGTYTVTLTTTWAGRYRVDGDPTWREVTGTATTATTSSPFEAQERTSRLVSELCSATPTPPDC